MEKVLNQEEIDAMVRAARGGATAAAKAPTVVAWDVHKAGQIGREQVHSISVLHEAFARNLTDSLGAYLRIIFQATLVSVEHLRYGDFLEAVPEVAYLASCKLAPIGAVGVLQLDLPVAFALIDVLLGGEGTSATTTREVTEIEEQILETVMHIICRELQTAWQALALEFQFEHRQRADQVQHLMPGSEKILSLSFEITMAQCHGMLNFVLPAVVSNALLRKMNVSRVRSKLRLRADSEQRIHERLLQCPFRMELSTDAGGVRAANLIGLAPGDVLVLRQRLEQPATLLLGGHPMFRAILAKRGPRRVAQLLERYPIPEPERKR